jgi:hypothetical protein
MALGDFGYFQPAEAYWGKSPGAYETAMQAQGEQTAKYLAMMDQYYAGMEMQQEQFEATMEQRESEFSRSLGFSKEQLAWQKEYGARELDLREFQTKTQASVARSQIGLGYSQLEAQSMLGQQQLGLEASLGQQKLDLAERGQAFEEKSFTLQLAMFKDMLQKQEDSKKKKTPGVDTTAISPKPSTAIDPYAGVYTGGVPYEKSYDLLTDMWG